MCVFVIQPCNNLIQIHNATIFIERNENKGPVSSLLRIYSFVWPHVWTSFAYYLFDSHERFACPKAPHTSYISTSFYKWKTTKQYGSLWNLFNKLWLGTRTNATYLSLNTWWPNLFCVQPGFFFQNAIFFLLYEITK